jgi:hypothetical protein
MLKLIPGLGRELLDESEIQLAKAGTVLFDEQRRRPRYFDGRFLAARDLTREQTYFLGRQSSLGQVLGSGVIAGLLVQDAPGASGKVRISAGYGLTPGGELVALDSDLTVDLDEVAEAERLNAAFGLRRLPQPPLRARTGLFVLGLRPVEFTANPIASYPASLDGPRTLEDGDIVEASAVSLVPYPEEGTRDDAGLRRARVARTIFVEGSTRGIPANLLPLAMVSLERGVVQWADSFLVRREVGAGHAGSPALGIAPQALREAHLMQYEEHLQSVLAERGPGASFAATEHFLALPPAGRLPKGAILDTLTQVYFPPEVEVDLAIVPEDEVPALLRESLTLPPIDLTAGRDTLESTPVLALLPAARKDVRELSAILPSLVRTLRSPVPGAVAQLKPEEMIKALALPMPPLVQPAGGGTEDQAWLKALSAAAGLWYVRRRNMSRQLERLGTKVSLGPGSEQPLLAQKGISLETIYLFQPYLLERVVFQLRERVDSITWGVLAQTFSELTGRRVLLEGALREAEKKDPLDEASAKDVQERFIRLQVREGLEELIKVKEGLLELPSKPGGMTGTILTPVGKAVVGARVVPELCELSYDCKDDLARALLGDEILAAVGSATGTGTTVQSAVRNLILGKIQP